MKNRKNILFALLCALMIPSLLFSQTDEEQIRALRTSSNSALKAYDHAKVLSYLTEDALTTTGNGTVLCGKKELEQYILDGGKSDMYWVRNPEEITVNQKRGLAWESGTWNGYDSERGEVSIIKGRYAAMWTKKTGSWKIKSQLFVTIEEN
ncbi:YybH family protein [Croceiramulus getboli]|nr:nuclear transport factor 2 family protein [Flavobacteriaceae bacterium YJPT1-3]